MKTTDKEERSSYGSWEVYEVDFHGLKEYIGTFNGYIDFIALKLGLKYKKLYFSKLSTIQDLREAQGAAYEVDVKIDPELKRKNETTMDFLKDVLKGRECMVNICSTGDPEFVRISRVLTKEEEIKKILDELSNSYTITEGHDQQNISRLRTLLEK